MSARDDYPAIAKLDKTNYVGIGAVESVDVQARNALDEIDYLRNALIDHMVEFHPVNSPIRAEGGRLLGFVQPHPAMTAESEAELSEGEGAVDSAGVREAPCAGQQHPDGECSICGHLTAEHDPRLVCGRCHEVCGYCGQFYDQHDDGQWRSCRIDLDARLGEQS